MGSVFGNLIVECGNLGFERCPPFDGLGLAAEPVSDVVGFEHSGLVGIGEGPTFAPGVGGWFLRRVIEPDPSDEVPPFVSAGSGIGQIAGGRGLLAS